MDRDMVEHDALSNRELEILRLVATGASNKEIASQLNISINTVKVHIRRIFNKIGADSRTEAALFALNTGLVTGELVSPVQPNVEDAELAAAESPPAPVRRTFLRGYIISGVVILGLLVYVAYSAFAFPPANPPVSTASSTATLPEWQPLAPLPSARSGLAAVAFDGWVYAIGGGSAETVTGDVQAYNPVTNQWRNARPKPLPVRDVAAVVIGGKIFVPGGETPDGKPTTVVEIYDPYADSWSQAAPLPAAVSGYGLAAFDGRLYLFGGWDGSAYHSTVYRYDHEQDTWSELASMPTERAYLGAAVVGRKILVVGGQNEGAEALKVTEVFSPDLAASPNGPWQVGPPMPYSLASMGITSVADIVYVVGGDGAPERQGTILVYYDQAAEWQVVSSEAVELGASVGMANLGQHLFVMGGMLGEQPVAQSYKYQAVYTVSFPFVIR